MGQKDKKLANQEVEAEDHSDESFEGDEGEEVTLC